MNPRSTSCCWSVAVGRHRLLDVDGRSDRATEVVSREEPHGDATLDQHPDRKDAGDAPRRPDELADAGPERRGIASTREAGAEVDGDDAPRDREREQWCRAAGPPSWMPRARSAAVGPARSPRTAPSIVAPGRCTGTGLPSARNQTCTPAPATPGKASAPPRGREMRCISCQLDSPPGRASPTENRQRAGKAQAAAPQRR